MQNEQNAISIPKPVIGLVGGVGAGKSTAAAEFEALGCLRIDADRIGHDVLGEAEVADELRRRWGETVFAPDGAVDRQAVGKIVFADPAELTALNEITWPRIGQRIAERIAEAQAAPGVLAVVLDAAVMFEAGWDRLCSHVLFVEAPDADRAGRAIAKGLGEKDWRNREKSQFSLDRKRSRCYRELDSSSSVSHLREQIRRAFHQITSRAD